MITLCSTLTQSLQHNTSIRTLLTSYGMSYTRAHVRIHADGVHGIEMLYTCLGTGCRAVSRTCSEDVDVCVGTWDDGRVG